MKHGLRQRDEVRNGCHSSERKSARTLLKLRLPRLPLIEVIATDDPCLPLIEVVLVGAFGRG